LTEGDFFICLLLYKRATINIMAQDLSWAVLNYRISRPIRCTMIFSLGI